jgi:orotate phosphoribosyltransferase
VEFIDPNEVLTRGSGLMNFRQASETGFAATADVDGASVLLIDDTFTTGARIHSAAHALQVCGAHVMAGVVIARKINPDPTYFTEAVWNRQSEIHFDFLVKPWWAD